MFKARKIAVIIAAAGKSSRMKSDISKQFLNIGDKPVLAHSLEAFSSLDLVDEIILVSQEEDIISCQEDIVDRYNIGKVVAIVAGGETREESVYRGLEHTSEDIDIVISHDGARPFIGKEHIIESVEMAIEYGACVLGVPVKDTIKLSSGGLVEETLERSRLWAIQTPQTFNKELLLRAYENSIEKRLSATDDSSLVEALGRDVKIIMGDYKNIKITTPEDLIIANRIAETR